MLVSAKVNIPDNREPLTWKEIIKKDGIYRPIDELECYIIVLTGWVGKKKGHMALYVNGNGSRVELADYGWADGEHEFCSVDGSVDVSFKSSS